MSQRVHTTTLRVRYSETDQMGTFYNSRALEWFECGRTEVLRALGVPYATMEDRGVLLPVIEAYIQYFGRARYDDALEVRTAVELAGKASLKFLIEIVQARDGSSVVRGHTTHAIVDKTGKPTRPPAWLLEAVAPASND